MYLSHLEPNLSGNGGATIFFLQNVLNRGLKDAASRRPDSPQVLRVGRGAVQDALFPPQPPQLQLQEVYVLHALVVVEVSLAEDRLLDADLLVQQGALVVAAQQVLAQVVSLSQHLGPATEFRQGFIFAPWRRAASPPTCSSCFFS